MIETLKFLGIKDKEEENRRGESILPCRTPPPRYFPYLLIANYPEGNKKTSLVFHRRPKKMMGQQEGVQD